MVWALGSPPQGRVKGEGKAGFSFMYAAVADTVDNAVIGRECQQSDELSLTTESSLWKLAFVLLYY